MAYTKVNWQNAPSTDTPINATNLNKMDTGIYNNANDITKINNRGIINVGLTATTSSVSVNSAIPFNTVVNNVGNTLSFNSSSHGVVIGENVNYVEVSSMIAVQYSSSNAIYSFVITKNGTEITNMRSFTYKSASQIFSATMPPILLQVSQGDVIAVKVKDNAAAIRTESFLCVRTVA